MAREINCKIVYYGPGLCGKTTNLQYIYERTNPEAKGKMISLATETERTLFFDFLPLALGEIRGFKTRFHLYTVPGQVFYDASRKLILKGVDGVVFVADSQIERMEANQESLENLRTNLAEQGYSLDKLPYVIQYNKRDLPNIATVEELRELLNPPTCPTSRPSRAPASGSSTRSRPSPSSCSPSSRRAARRAAGDGDAGEEAVRIRRTARALAAVGEASVQSVSRQSPSTQAVGMPAHSALASQVWPSRQPKTGFAMTAQSGRPRRSCSRSPARPRRRWSRRSSRGRTSTRAWAAGCRR
jgi:signal recognition particle receptor subunit beta